RSVQRGKDSGPVPLREPGRASHTALRAANRLSRSDEVLERRLRLGVRTGLETAVGVDPQLLTGNRLLRELQQLRDLLRRGNARRVDVPHARSDLALVAVVADRGEHLHARAGRLDRGDVRAKAVDRIDDLAELRVAQVRVDLSVVRGA